MKTKLALSVLLGAALFAAILVEPTAALFENDQVKVVRALEKAHVKGKFHEHKPNRVMIYLQSGRQRFEYQDGRPPKIADWHEGQVEWSAPEGMHAPEVLSDEPFNIIEVELKSNEPGKKITAKFDPVKIDPKHYSVAFENPQVRVLRVKIEGHGVTPMHEHAVNRVTVFLTDQQFRVKDLNGKVDTVTHKAGEAIFGTPVTHTEENLSEKPFEVLAVELKSAS